MRCLVIMPFGNPDVDPAGARELELIYSQWIKPSVEELRLPGPDAAGAGEHVDPRVLRPIGAGQEVRV